MYGKALQAYEETLSLRELATQGSAAGARPETRPPRVFVIDDEEGICRFVAGAVGNLGCEAESFTNAQVALRALRRSPPDIIFLDIAIGGSDAIDVLRNLADCGFRGVVQVMSGSNPSLLEDVRKVGERHKLVMRPPLQKPFRFDAIQKVLAGAPLDRWMEEASSPNLPASVSLDEALEQGWLEVWYQPKLDLAAHTFPGAEGLIRCRHPEHGVLSPASFLPGASAKSLVALTEYVVLTALRDWQELSQIGFNLQFAVNASIGALTDLNLPKLIRANRPKDDAWPGLIIEVTEGEVASDVGLAHEIATQLNIYGIKLAIDDFGEGYSSFARLRDLPFAELKLDASFVQNCAEDTKNAAICRAVIELAHSFGAVAVAEGLETAADVQAIQRMGCDLGQGFLFARPMPSTLFTSLLQARAARGDAGRNVHF